MASGKGLPESFLWGHLTAGAQLTDGSVLGPTAIDQWNGPDAERHDFVGDRRHLEVNHPQEPPRARDIASEPTANPRRHHPSVGRRGGEYMVDLANVPALGFD